MDWIKVEDRLPPDDKDVLILVEGFFRKRGEERAWISQASKKVFQASFHRRFGWYSPDRSSHDPIIAWMPLPECHHNEVCKTGQE